MLRWLTAGESHGPALVGVIGGVPAGAEIHTAMRAARPARRGKGYGRGARMSFEQDKVRLLGGVRHGRTQGGPIAIEIANTEWPKWEHVMAADPVDPALLQIDAGTGDTREVARNKPLTRPRPGHADLTGMIKYVFEEDRKSTRLNSSHVAVSYAVFTLQ